MSSLVPLALLLVVVSFAGVGKPAVEQHSSHTNNWAVLVRCTEDSITHVRCSIYGYFSFIGILSAINLCLFIATDCVK